MSKVPLKTGLSATPNPHSVGGKTPQTCTTTVALASTNATEQQLSIPQTSITVTKSALLNIIAEMLAAIICNGKPSAHIKQEILKVINYTKESKIVVEGEGKEGEAHTKVSDTQIALQEDIHATLWKDLVKLHNLLEIQIAKM